MVKKQAATATQLFIHVYVEFNSYILKHKPTIPIVHKLL